MQIPSTVFSRTQNTNVFILFGPPCTLSKVPDDILTGPWYANGGRHLLSLPLPPAFVDDWKAGAGVTMFNLRCVITRYHFEHGNVAFLLDFSRINLTDLTALGILPFLSYRYDNCCCFSLLLTSMIHQEFYAYCNLTFFTFIFWLYFSFSFDFEAFWPFAVWFIISCHLTLSLWHRLLTLTFGHGIATPPFAVSMATTFRGSAPKQSRVLETGRRTEEMTAQPEPEPTVPSQAGSPSAELLMTTFSQPATDLRQSAAQGPLSWHSL